MFQIKEEDLTASFDTGYLPATASQVKISFALVPAPVGVLHVVNGGLVALVVQRSLLWGFMPRVRQLTCSHFRWPRGETWHAWSLSHVKATFRFRIIRDITNVCTYTCTRHIYQMLPLLLQSHWWRKLNFCWFLLRQPLLLPTSSNLSCINIF